MKKPLFIFIICTLHSLLALSSKSPLLYNLTMSCTDIGRHITKQLKVYLFYAQQTQVLQS